MSIPEVTKELADWIAEQLCSRFDVGEFYGDDVFEDANEVDISLFLVNRWKTWESGK